MKRAAVLIITAFLLVATASQAQNPLDNLFGDKPKPGPGQPPAGAAQQPAPPPASVRPRAGIPPSVGARAAAEWTFLVYMAADSNLDPAAVADVKEMEQVGSSDAVKIVAFLDRSSNPQYNRTGWKGARQALILSNPGGGEMRSFDTNQSTCESLGEVDSGNAGTFQRFVQWGTSRYPARHFALVVWNHGGGWRSVDIGAAKGRTRDICLDYTSGNRIFNRQLREALEQVGVRYEIIGMDACLMGMIEVAYEFKDLTGVLLASSQNVPGAGFDYTPFLRSLASNPSMSGEELAQQMFQSFGNYYQRSQEKVATLSLVRSGQVSPLVQSLNGLLQQLQREAQQQVAIPYRESLASARRKADCIAAQRNIYVDLGEFLSGLAQDSQISPGLREAANQTVRLYQNAVAMHYSKPESAGTGLSIYFPDSSSEKFLEEYSSDRINFAKDCYWPYFVKAFVQGTPIQIPVSGYPGNSTPGGVTPGGITPGGVTPGGVTPGGIVPGGIVPGGVVPGGVVPGGVAPGNPNPIQTAFSAGVQIMGVILTDSREGRTPVDRIQPGVTYWCKFRSRCGGAQANLKETVTICGASANGQIIPGSLRYNSYRYSDGDNIYTLQFTAPQENVFRVIVDHFVSDAQDGILYSDYMSRDFQMGGSGGGVESAATRSLARPKSLAQLIRNGVEEKQGSKVLAPSVTGARPRVTPASAGAPQPPAQPGAGTGSGNPLDTIFKDRR